MQKAFSAILALLLWLISIVFGIFEIVVVRDAMLTLYLWVISWGGTAPERLHNTYWPAVFIGQITTIVLAIAMLALTVGTGEYHAKYFGERRSWRLFGWTLGIELLIFLVASPFA